MPFIDWLLGWLKGAPDKMGSLGGLISLLWAIWRVRNKRVFNGIEGVFEEGLRMVYSPLSGASFVLPKKRLGRFLHPLL